MAGGLDLANGGRQPRDERRFPDPRPGGYPANCAALQWDLVAIAALANERGGPCPSRVRLDALDEAASTLLDWVVEARSKVSA